MDVLLTHASLFPRQLRQFLQTLGRKVLTFLMAVAMPFVLWLGLGGQPGRMRATATTQAPLLNLIYVGLPAEGYQEVPQPAASNRRGLWEKSCPDWDREIQLVIVAEGSNDKSVLPFDLFSFRSNLAYSYQTILPNLDWDNWCSANLF